MGSSNGKMVLREEDVAVLSKTSGLRKGLRAVLVCL
jgi:hypothetical protein